MAIIAVLQMFEQGDQVIISDQFEEVRRRGKTGTIRRIRDGYAMVIFDEPEDEDGCYCHVDDLELYDDIEAGRPDFVSVPGTGQGRADAEIAPPEEVAPAVIEVDGAIVTGSIVLKEAPNADKVDNRPPLKWRNRDVGAATCGAAGVAENVDKATSMIQDVIAPPVVQCNVITKSGRPCTMPLPCRVHTEEWHFKRERPAMHNEDRASKRACRPICGAKTRTGTAGGCANICTAPLPCAVHTLAPGKKWCSSSLTYDPGALCSVQVAKGTMFCGAHKEFPDLGRKAGIYRQMCLDNDVAPETFGFGPFLEWAYPHTDGVPDFIEDFDKFSEVNHKKMIE